MKKYIKFKYAIAIFVGFAVGFYITHLLTK